MSSIIAHSESKNSSKKEESSKDEYNKCQNCTENTLSVYCMHCHKHLCSVCDKFVHIKGNATKHDRVGVSQRNRSDLREPNAPSNVSISPLANGDGFEMVWNCSPVEEGQAVIFAYRLKIKMVMQGKVPDKINNPQEYIKQHTPVMHMVAASTVSSTMSYYINKKKFDGKMVYATVTAIDVHGLHSKKARSEVVQLPQRTGTLIHLQYTYDFDTNGVLYYIGTSGGTRPYVNPHLRGEVLAKWSSVGAGSVEYFVNHAYPSDEGSYTKSRVRYGYDFANEESCEWMMVDLGVSRRLTANYYTLRHDKNANIGYMRDWVLEGSNTARHGSWYIIKSHTNDISLNRPGKTCSWPLIDVKDGYRYFRVHLTGVNTELNHHLCCSGIELYGYLFIL